MLCDPVTTETVRQAEECGEGVRPQGGDGRLVGSIYKIKTRKSPGSAKER